MTESEMEQKFHVVTALSKLLDTICEGFETKCEQLVAQREQLETTLELLVAKRELLVAKREQLVAKREQLVAKREQRETTLAKSGAHKQERVAILRCLAGTSKEIADTSSEIAAISSEIAGINIENAGINTEIAGTRSTIAELADLSMEAAGVINELNACVNVTRRTPSVECSDSSHSVGNSNSVASTSQYKGMNQFQVHIPSEYDADLRPSIEEEFAGVHGACIETQWQTIRGRLGVSLTVWTTTTSRAATVTVLQKYLGRLPEEGEVLPLDHKPNRKFRARHRPKDSVVEASGNTSYPTSESWR